MRRQGARSPSIPLARKSFTAASSWTYGISVLFQGGLCEALALALDLPDDRPRQHEMLTAAFAVVAFSISAQGLTMTPLLRILG